MNFTTPKKSTLGFFVLPHTPLIKYYHVTPFVSYFVSQISPSEAKMYLHMHRWSPSEVIKLLPPQSPAQSSAPLSPTLVNFIPSHQQQLYPSPSSSSSTTSTPHKTPSTGGQQDRHYTITTPSPLTSCPSIMTNADLVTSTSISSQQTASTPSSTFRSPSSQSPSSGHSIVPSRQRSLGGKLHPLVAGETFLFCDVCAVTQASADFSHLACRHLFCKGCWELHFECQILQGLSTSE